MQIELYKFSKRINSTKRPVAGSGLTTQCTIKQNAPYVGTFGSSSDTTVCYPVLFLSGVTNPNQYNYCKTFDDRYYFIRDVQVDIDGAATLHCEIDVLATRKTEILASTQYVLYSASNYNLKMVDPRMPRQNNIKVDMDFEAISSPEFNPQHPTFIIKCLAEDFNLITLYATDDLGLAEVAYWLTDIGNENVFDQMRWYLQAPSKAIVSISMCPFDLFRDGASEIQLGHTTIAGTKARILNYGGYSQMANVLLEVDPQGELDYTYSDAYSSYVLKIPLCNDMVIPGDILFDAGSTAINVNIFFNYGTGDIYAVARLRNSPFTKLGTTSGNMYFDLPWGDLGGFQGAAIVDAIQGVLSALTVGAVSNFGESDAQIITSSSKGSKTIRNVNDSFSGKYHGGFDASGSIIGNSIMAGFMNSQGQVRSTSCGHGYGESYVNYSIEYYRYYNPIAQESLTSHRNLLGLPCNKVLQLSSLSGYCQCKNPSIVIDDLKVIAELINGYLSSGFFIE